MKSFNVKAAVLTAALAVTLTVPAASPALAETSDANNAPADSTVSKSEIKTSLFAVNVTIQQLNGKYEDVTGARVIATNLETGKTYEYISNYKEHMKNIGTENPKEIHQYIPVGKYKLHLDPSSLANISELKGKKYQLPEDKNVEVFGLSQYDALALIELPAQEDKKDQDAKPANPDAGSKAAGSKADNNDSDNKVNPSEGNKSEYTGFYPKSDKDTTSSDPASNDSKAAVSSASDKAASVKAQSAATKALPQTSDVSPVAPFVAVAGSAALIAAGLLARRVEE